MENLFEQMANITKANGFDILADHVKELKEQNNIQLEALKDCYRYLEVSYQDDDLSNQGKAARLKVIEAIQQCEGKETHKEKAKNISDDILKTINTITDQYKKDHNL